MFKFGALFSLDSFITCSKVFTIYQKIIISLQGMCKSTNGLTIIFQSLSPHATITKFNQFEQITYNYNHKRQYMTPNHNSNHMKIRLT
jgi:hypothetical protein